MEKEAISYGTSGSSNEEVAVNNFAMIAETHNEKLTRLRDNYEMFCK